MSNITVTDCDFTQVLAPPFRSAPPTLPTARDGSRKSPALPPTPPLILPNRVQMDPHRKWIERVSSGLMAAEAVADRCRPLQTQSGLNIKYSAYRGGYVRDIHYRK